MLETSIRLLTPLSLGLGLLPIVHWVAIVLQIFISNCFTCVGILSIDKEF